MINIKIIIITAVMIIIFIMTCYFNRAIRSISITIINIVYLNSFNIFLTLIVILRQGVFSADFESPNNTRVEV